MSRNNNFPLEKNKQAKYTCRFICYVAGLRVSHLRRMGNGAHVEGYTALMMSLCDSETTGTLLFGKSRVIPGMKRGFAAAGKSRPKHSFFFSCV